MNLTGSTLKILLEKYPDLISFTKKIAGVDLSNYNGNALYKRQSGYEDNDLIKELIEILPAYPGSGNLWTLVYEGLSKLFIVKIKETIIPFKESINDIDSLALNVSNQAMNSLSCDVSQLCIFLSKIKKSAELYPDSWDVLFQNYSVLENKISGHVEHVTSVLCRVFSRLIKDKDLIKKKFSIDVFKVEYVDILLGDYHYHGDSVARIKLQEKSIIYKPRNAKNEDITKKLISLLTQSSEIKIGVPEFICKEEYSWHEYINFANSKNQEDVYNYYKNVGSAISFFNAFFGCDFHFENVICVKDTPYFVDLECMFSGSMKLNFFSNSVLTTCMIPSLAGSNIDRFLCGIGVRDKIGNKKLRKNIPLNEQMEVKVVDMPTEIPNHYNRPVYVKGSENNDYLKNNIITGFIEMNKRIKE